MTLLYIGTVFYDSIVYIESDINFGTSNSANIFSTYGGIANILERQLLKSSYESLDYILLADKKNIFNLSDHYSSLDDLCSTQVLDIYSSIPKSIIIEENGLRRTSFSQFPNFNCIPQANLQNLCSLVNKRLFNCLAFVYGDTIPMHFILPQILSLSEKTLAVDFCRHELMMSFSELFRISAINRCKELLIFCSYEDIHPSLYDLIASFGTSLILISHSPTDACISIFNEGRLFCSENVPNAYYLPKDVKLTNGLGDKFMFYVLLKYICSGWGLRESIIYAQKSINLLLNHEL